MQVVESCIVKMRKPERRIYEHVLKELDVQGPEVIFLDDIGQNLKAAAQLGIRTIKVKIIIIVSYCILYQNHNNCMCSLACYDIKLITGYTVKLLH